MSEVFVRPARARDVPELPPIEKSGDGLFRAEGMDLVADGEPATTGDFADSLAAGRLFVAEDRAAVVAPGDDHDTGRIVGFARVDIIDGLPHVEQLSVAPSHRGHRLGAALLAAAEDWARAEGYDRLTLRTFASVPWNGPYYERLGWVAIPVHEEGPEMAGLARNEEAAGLMAWPRQAMIRRL